SLWRLRRESGQRFLGYDAARREYCDLLERGIVDPCKTVRMALANAASCAAMILSTEAVIVGVGPTLPTARDMEPT
ncbi:MAG: chaperonin GroEL, partial [Chloroflexi bacterium]|nr:chaperonin GroEL [Chloroflexota bacterium]